MITFLPWPDFKASAKSLDYKRLGKQRVEGYQILRGLLGESKGWIHHPASKMWKGYEIVLADYTLTMITEWKNRGYNDSLQDKVINLFSNYKVDATRMGPSWLGREDVHRSHRANLVHKFPEFYIPQFGNLEPELYIWPV